MYKLNHTSSPSGTRGKVKTYHFSWVVNSQFGFELYVFLASNAQCPRTI